MHCILMCDGCPHWTMHSRIRFLPSLQREDGEERHLIGVVLHVLQRLQHAQRLLDVAPERQIVDRGMLDDALREDAAWQAD